MAVKRLSEIAFAPAPPALTDTVVGVGGGTTDYQYTLTQIKSTVGGGSTSLTVGTTPVASGTDNYALTVGGGILGNSPLRTLITANTNYYVSVTGNDSNPGTIGSPWATLQHAAIFIASTLDIAGFLITVNIGAGSFVGFGQPSCVGGGNVYFLGAGSASTTITAGPNDGAINFGDCVDVPTFNDTGLSVNAVTLQGGAFPETIAIYSPGSGMVVGDLINFTSADIIITGTGQRFLSIYVTAAVNLTAGTYTDKRTGSYQGLINLFGGYVITNGCAITVTNNPTWFQAAIICQRGTTFSDAFGFTISGAASGPQYICTGNSVLQTNGQTIPGSTAGQLGSGSAVDVGNGENVFTVGTLPSGTSSKGASATVTDSNATLAAGLGNIVATGGANIVPVYCDGTNWRIG